jgi:HAD superfamily hydrolase (TIGR01490 family)
VKAVQFRLSGSTDEMTDAVRDQMLAAVGGRQQSDLVSLNEAVLPELLGMIRPEARNLIDQHHAAGRDTYIVSASPIELVEPLARALDMTGGIGTVSEVVDGVYTGRLAGPFCYGDGKAIAIGDLAKREGIDLEKSWGYSDSSSDLPMLEIVGHPVAVNPDANLSRVARERGWPVVVFSQRTKTVVRRSTAASGAIAIALLAYSLGVRRGRSIN